MQLGPKLQRGIMLHFKSNKNFLFAILSLLVVGTFFSTRPAQAFMALSESGEMIKNSDYQIGIAPQFLLNDERGANVTAFADYLFNDSTSFRAHLGAGTVDFHSGVSAKFIPFPDIDQQPAMGVRGGVFFVRDSSESNLAFQLAPLASKKVETEYGLFTPYSSIAFSYINWREKKKTGTQFILGTEFTQYENTSLKFGSELGISLNDSYSYILGYVSWSFERQRR